MRHYRLSGVFVISSGKFLRRFWLGRSGRIDTATLWLAENRMPIASPARPGIRWVFTYVRNETTRGKSLVLKVKSGKVTFTEAEKIMLSHFGSNPPIWNLPALILQVLPVLPWPPWILFFPEMSFITPKNTLMIFYLGMMVSPLMVHLSFQIFQATTGMRVDPRTCGTPCWGGIGAAVRICSSENFRLSLLGLATNFRTWRFQLQTLWETVHCQRQCTMSS